MFYYNKGEITVRDDGTKYETIVTQDTSKCPFCGNTKIRSGSWTPEYCTVCGAVYFWKQWHRDLE